MTDSYEEWRNFYAEKVRSWMSLDELRSECGKLTTTDAPSTEVLLIHAMHLLERYEQRDMTDRDLLEPAAKAAGIELRWHPDGTAYSDSRCKGYWGVWNPLTDDGDALRLFLTIRGELHTVDDMNTPTLNSVYILRGCQLHREWLRDHGNDPYAATRRAIVRAAAEIGRNTA